MKTPLCVLCGSKDTEVGEFWAGPEEMQKFHIEDPLGIGYMVSCKDCGACGPIGTTEVEAIALYNAKNKKFQRLQELNKKIVRYEYIVDYPHGAIEPGVVTFGTDFLNLLNEIADLIGE